MTDKTTLLLNHNYEEDALKVIHVGISSPQLDDCEIICPDGTLTVKKSIISWLSQSLSDVAEKKHEIYLEAPMELVKKCLYAYFSSEAPKEEEKEIIRQIRKKLNFFEYLEEEGGYRLCGIWVLKDIRNGQDSDITIVGDDKIEFKAHKFVLKARSSIFQSFFDESERDDVIHLEGFGSIEIKSLLDYVYLGRAYLHTDLLPSFLEKCSQLGFKIEQAGISTPYPINREDLQKGEQSAAFYFRFHCEECIKEGIIKHSFMYSLDHREQEHPRSQLKRKLQALKNFYYNHLRSIHNHNNSSRINGVDFPNSE